MRMYKPLHEYDNDFIGIIQSAKDIALRNSRHLNYEWQEKKNMVGPDHMSGKI